MPIPHVKPGQPWKPLKANEHNLVVDAANAHAADQAGSTFDRAPADRVTDHIQLSNASGFDAVKGEALGINTPTVSPVDDADHAAARVRHAGANPTSTYLGKFAVLDESAAKTAFSRAVVSGLVYAQIVVVETWHEYADIDKVSTSRVLVSTSAGSAPAQIIWKETGTGTKWALLRLANAGQFHLVGVPVGNGITARSFTTAGSGVVQVYRLVGSTLTAVVNPSLQPVYQTVYSLSDDPILSTTSHQYPSGTGGIYVGYGTDNEYYLLHCDRWGTWWIEPHQRTMLAKIAPYLSGTLRAPAGGGYSDSGYLTCSGSPGGGYENLDNEIINALAATFENSVCQIRLTGDYTVTMDWGGGAAARESGTSATLWYQVTVSLQYYPPGGPWTDLFAKIVPTTGSVDVVNTVTRVLPQSYLLGTSSADMNGRSLTTAIRLTAGTYLRFPVSIARLTASDALLFGNSPDYLRARLTLTKHV